MTRNVMTQMVSTDVRVSFGSVRASGKLSDASFKDAVESSMKKDAGVKEVTDKNVKAKDAGTEQPKSVGKTVNDSNANKAESIKAEDVKPEETAVAADIPSDEDLKEVMEELAGIMMQFANELANEVLDVPVNEITDWLQGKNLELVDLLSKDTNYKMLLDFTGMNDISGLLTNEDAFLMMTEIDVKVESLYQFIGIPEDQSFVNDFIDRFKGLEEFFPVTFKPLELNEVKIETEKNDENALELVDTGKNEAPVEVTVEAQSETETKAETSDKKEENIHVSHSHENVSFNSFFEKLSDAVDKLSGAKEMMQYSDGFNNFEILDQVMDHIKAEITPESTTMEFMLNPESLGRVAVSVTDKNGNMTAKISCENQVAKENLEAQLTTLKQTFEEQGLKVESVEINVSDFNFTRDEEEGKNNGQEEKKKSRRTLTLDEINAKVDGIEGQEEETQTRRIDPRLYGYRVDYFG